MAEPRMPQSSKLAREMMATQVPKEAPKLFVPLDTEPLAADATVFRIKPIDCLNDFVAIARFRIKSTIELQNDNRFKNEGIVVGVGPGIAEFGQRVSSQLKIGDVVCFRPQNIVLQIEGSRFYGDIPVVVMQERTLLLKLPPVKFEVEKDQECKS